MAGHSQERRNIPIPACNAFGSEMPKFVFEGGTDASLIGAWGADTRHNNPLFSSSAKVYTCSICFPKNKTKKNIDIRHHA